MWPLEEQILHIRQQNLPQALESGQPYASFLEGVEEDVTCPIFSASGLVLTVPLLEEKMEVGDPRVILERVQEDFPPRGRAPQDGYKKGYPFLWLGHFFRAGV